MLRPQLDEEISTSRCILYNILIVKIVKPDDGRQLGRNMQFFVVMLLR
jgi:hypothetical protein